MIHIIAHHIGHILAIWFALSAFIVVVGVSMANRLPAEVAEDEKAMNPTEGAHGAYVEPEHVREKRLFYAQRRDRIFLASRRERAEGRKP